MRYFILQAGSILLEPLYQKNSACRLGIILQVAIDNSFLGIGTYNLCDSLNLSDEYYTVSIHTYIIYSYLKTDMSKIA